MESAEVSEPSPSSKPKAFRRGIRFSLRTLLLLVLLIASGTTLRWRWDPWAVERVLHGHTSHVTDICFSPDGRWLATGGGDQDGTCRLWDISTGRQLATIPTQHDAVGTDISPDGRMLLTSGGANNSFMGGSVCLWDVSTQERLLTIEGMEHYVYTAQFSPNGETIAVANRNELRLFHVATGARLRKVADGDFLSACFSPSGDRIVTTNVNGTVALWDIESGRRIWSRREHCCVVYECEYSRDGRRIVTASNDGTARVWDAATGEQVGILRGHASGISDAIFSPDGELVITLGHDDKTRMSRLDGVSLPTTFPPDIRSAAFSPDGQRLVLGGDDGTVTVYALRRAASTYGVLMLPETWITVILLLVLTLSLGSDYLTLQKSAA